VFAHSTLLKIWVLFHLASFFWKKIQKAILNEHFDKIKTLKGLEEWMELLAGSKISYWTSIQVFPLKSQLPFFLPLVTSFGCLLTWFENFESRYSSANFGIFKYVSSSI
jgi:hypothetical protein